MPRFLATKQPASIKPNHGKRVGKSRMNPLRPALVPGQMPAGKSGILRRRYAMDADFCAMERIRCAMKLCNCAMDAAQRAIGVAFCAMNPRNCAMAVVLCVILLIHCAPSDRHCAPHDSYFALDGINSDAEEKISCQLQIPGAGHFPFLSSFQAKMRRKDFPPSVDPDGFDRVKELPDHAYPV